MVGLGIISLVCNLYCTFVSVQQCLVLLKLYLRLCVSLHCTGGEGRGLDDVWRGVSG